MKGCVRMIDCDYFMFDENCSPWTESREYNTGIITMEINHLSDIIRYRGYIYLNQIYEAFGIKWDTQRDNLKRLYVNGEKKEFMAFHETEKPNTWKIITYF